MQCAAYSVYDTYALNLFQYQGLFGWKNVRSSDTLAAMVLYFPHRQNRDPLAI